MANQSGIRNYRDKASCSVLRDYVVLHFRVETAELKLRSIRRLNEFVRREHSSCYPQSLVILGSDLVRRVREA